MNVLIFGGTTEGRLLAASLSRVGHAVTLSVATEYGKEIADCGTGMADCGVGMADCSVGTADCGAGMADCGADFCCSEERRSSNRPTLLTGRLDASEMCELLASGAFDRVIDATHPYAALATKNIRAACESAGLKYMRLMRPESAAVDGVEYVADAAAAAKMLNGGTEKALLTIGSKDLAAFTCINNYAERLFIRLLPMQASLTIATELGFRSSNIICMQGPFSVEMNIATLNMTGARCLVTKESGSIGGFEAKVAAAKSLGCKLIVISRPVMDSADNYTMGELFGVDERLADIIIDRIKSS